MARRKPDRNADSCADGRRQDTGSWFSRLSGRGGVSVSRRSALREWLDDCSEALALAEAGEPELAGEVMRREGARKIVVLGTGSGFARPLGEYALGLAERLSCDLVFLSVGPADASARRRGAFTASAREAATAWIKAAAGRGLRADHEVRFGETAASVEAVCAALRRVEFVLGSAADGEGLGGRLTRPLFVVR
ncbi:hypothetical protein dsx2_2132 [Desulfovibrio sp. X2]|uniref:hypothetical protein n=1 Tax=Desulfovibrio sp. X2 TaxID=941449 RepID=UPI0003589709|nr:hypothetical protein [Desulfovibrio sp. X2]EPR43705.1 hypothetical protein dsx2_2132 [Desulfovibrio sp. X2]